jgi:hypothetical protein
VYLWMSQAVHSVKCSSPVAYASSEGLADCIGIFNRSISSMGCVGFLYCTIIGHFGVSIGSQDEEWSTVTQFAASSVCRVKGSGVGAEGGEEAEFDRQLSGVFRFLLIRRIDGRFLGITPTVAALSSPAGGLCSIFWR